MAEAIGTLIPSKIPSLSEAADIQEAFKLYHYGAPSGTNIGEYDPTNANVSNLVPQSIASYINTLNVKVAALEASPGIQPSQITGKGALITGTTVSTPATLAVGSDGFVLVADSSVANGIKWAAPSVTPDNTVTVTNKTIGLTGNTLTGTTAQFNTALSDNDFATLAGTETLTNKTLTSPLINSATATGLYISDAGITFEGTTANDFETILNGGDPTADRTITLPDASGTAITTGNLSAITSTGTLSSLAVTGNVVYHVGIETYFGGSPVLSSWDGKLIVIDSSSAVDIILPDTATLSFPQGTQFTILQKGTGQVSLAALNSTVKPLASPGLKLRARYSSCTVTKLTAPGSTNDEWAITGDLIA
jgi:hypothetical protein